MLKSFTLFRFYNFLILNISYLLRKLTGSFILWGKPITLSIEVSGKCQLSCPECPLGSGSNKQRTNMPPELFEKIIEQTHKHLWAVSLYFQGESLLNPEIYRYIRELKKRRIYVIISTNGNFSDNEIARKLVESGIDKILISYDGNDQETYSYYRKGGKLEKVKIFIKNINEFKKLANSKKPEIVMQTVINNKNENQLEEIYFTAKKFNARSSFKTMQISDLRNTGILPHEDKFRRYRINKNGKAEIKNKLKNHCYRIFHNPVITSQGAVLPCCFDKNLEHITGNINNQNFNEIWKSKKYDQFRKKVFSERKKIDICNNCTEGTKPLYVKSIFINRRKSGRPQKESKGNTKRCST